jgi:hypothetical protein
MNMREKISEAVLSVPLTHGYDIHRMLRPEEISAIADAILDALYEPDEEMVEAGSRALSDNGVDNLQDDDSLFAWRAMCACAKEGR